MIGAFGRLTRPRCTPRLVKGAARAAQLRLRLGARIRALRDARKLTQEVIAGRIGVSYASPPSEAQYLAAESTGAGTLHFENAQSPLYDCPHSMIPVAARMNAHGDGAASGSGSTALVVGKTTDDDLVDQTIVHLRRIWSEGLLKTVVAMGNYLIETFYGGSLVEAQSRSPRKPAALARLYERADDLPVSVHALKQCVRIAAQYHELPRQLAGRSRDLWAAIAPSRAPSPNLLGGRFFSDETLPELRPCV